MGRDAHPVGTAPVDDGGVVEGHSIDYIPKGERHGKAWHQATLWFAGNANLSTLVIGLLGIGLGLTLFWDLVAVTVGLAFGTLFMASHSVQGPRMGIPQMIQCRPQFGYLGALLPQTVGIFLYVGFNVFNTILAGQALAALTPLDSKAGVVVSFLLALLIAYGGYDWLHRFQRWFTYLFLVCFGIFSIGVLFTVNLPKAQSGVGGFHLTAFLIVLLATASYVVSEAPYVSDYSRYLRPGTTSRSCFLWTYAGSSIGALWVIALGAFLLAAFPGAQTADVILKGGDSIFSGFGTISLIVAFVMMIPVISMNMYGGSLTTITVIDSVRDVELGKRIRLLTILFIGVVATGLALTLPENFLGDYSNFLTILLYFLVPWTAINLMDFYVVRRGDYAITEIFKRHGIYGAWQWRGLVAYAVGFMVMIPFFATSIFTGPIAKAIGNADLSIFVGLPVSALVYYALARNVDREDERLLARTNEPEIMSVPLDADTAAV